MRRDLVEAAQLGDHEAFEVLATSAGDRLYAVARLILRESDLAEDAVQEALVRAWRQLPSLRDPDRFDAWIHRLVVNACADQGRQLTGSLLLLVHLQGLPHVSPRCGTDGNCASFTLYAPSRRRTKLARGPFAERKTRSRRPSHAQRVSSRSAPCSSAGASASGA
jgi:Sigma-70 region 2